MYRTKIFILLLAVGSLIWGVTPAAAQSKKSPQKRVMITDAAGRVHKVLPMRSTTMAQRKAAAQRAKAARAQVAAKKAVAQ